MLHVVLKTDFNLRSGYKRILDTILSTQDEYRLSIQPISLTSDIPEKYHNYFDTDHGNYDTEIILHPPPEDHMLHPLYRMNDHSNRIFFTMWEATKIHPSFVDVLNKCKCVIVPNTWNAKNFKKCGVKAQIHVLNLFVDDTIFNYTPPIEKQDIVFGTGNADARKRIYDVIRIFGETFQEYSNVKLSVKISTSEKKLLNRILNPKINIIVADYSSSELKKWYSDLDVYVSCVSSEGWGLMQHEALAIGRPVIGPSYAGMAEYMDKDISYPIKYSEVLADGYWKYPGSKWCMYDKDDLQKTLLHCYNNIHEVKSKGILASEKMTKLNIDKFMIGLTRIIRENYISRKN